MLNYWPPNFHEAPVAHHAIESGMSSSAPSLHASDMCLHDWARATTEGTSKLHERVVPTPIILRPFSQPTPMPSQHVPCSLLTEKRKP